MNVKTKQNRAVSSNGSPASLQTVDLFLKDSGKKKLTESQVAIILDALANSDDAEEVVRFPADNFKTHHRPPEGRPPRTADLDVFLNRLFSPKQKELVLKKRDGKAFTKTEREYYSRIVRKKLEAIVSEEVSGLARGLIYK